MGKLIFITGGARSGKSRFALQKALDLPAPHTFIATCPQLDAEMDQRIRKHKDERQGQGWQTIEEETDLADALTKAAPGVVLVDCLTLWMNNLMYSAEQSGQSFAEKDAAKAAQQLLAAARQFPGSVILVTNEVGLGITPDNALARQFRDNVGRSNQILAQAADEVILVISGIATVLKQSQV